MRAARMIMGAIKMAKIQIAKMMRIMTKISRSVLIEITERKQMRIAMRMRRTMTKKTKRMVSIFRHVHLQCQHLLLHPSYRFLLPRLHLTHLRLPRSTFRSLPSVHFRSLRSLPEPVCTALSAVSMTMHGQTRIRKQTRQLAQKQMLNRNYAQMLQTRRLRKRRLHARNHRPQQQLHHQRHLRSLQQISSRPRRHNRP